MSYNELLLIAHGDNISNATISVDYPGITINKIISTQSSSYLFIDVTVAPDTPAGTARFIFREGGRVVQEFGFVLLKKDRAGSRQAGLTAADVIYQIVPDRFANGNPENDNAKGYLEMADRLNPSGVHGGDIRGIVNHLDYIYNLGVTALELTPVFESNQFSLSYDRYQVTNFYKVDQRLGSLTDYIQMVNDCHNKGLKVVKTFVFHQAGKQNELFQNAPIDNWFVPDSKKYLEASDIHVFSDPYVSDEDYHFHKRSWSVSAAPKLNQQDAHLKKYLIQNCLWWIETSGVDAIRIDYTAYNDKDFLNELTSLLKKEYPNLSILCDVETQYPDQVAYWMQKNNHPQKFSVHFTHSADYPLNKYIGRAFSSFDQPTSGLMDLYSILARDFVYETPENNLIFVDDHRLDRAYNVADKELDQLKMMLAYVMTIRRTPSMLYGTELLLEGMMSKGPGFVRQDFPGGWPDDEMNAFNQKGLSSRQREFYEFVKTLLEWRKDSEAIHQGKLVHYKPAQGMYVYYRFTELKNVMVIFNNDPDEQKRFDFRKYLGNMTNYKFAKDIMTGDIYSDLSGILVYPKSVMILELEKTRFE
jgi:glycosidase